ncbi:MAG TPA: hypothetical protein DCQ64_23815 [Candidatus Rokubacteria bacterium]|nr:hypothetical protein [Candidatus Rokubacteria bacterium]
MTDDVRASLALALSAVGDAPDRCESPVDRDEDGIDQDRCGDCWVCRMRQATTFIRAAEAAHTAQVEAVRAIADEMRPFHAMATWAAARSWTSTGTAAAG